MQAIGKEGGGGDHLTVKAKLPSGVEEAPLGRENIYTGVPGMFSLSQHRQNAGISTPNYSILKTYISLAFQALPTKPDGSPVTPPASSLPGKRKSATAV